MAKWGLWLVIKIVEGLDELYIIILLIIKYSF